MALRRSFLVLTLVVGASHVILLVILTGRYNFAFGRYLTTAHQPIKCNGTDSVKNINRTKDSLNDWILEIHHPTKEHTGNKPTTPAGADRDVVTRNPMTVTTLRTHKKTVNGSLTPINPTTMMHDSNLKTANTLSSYDRHDSRLIVNSHEYKLLIDEPRACYDAAGAPREVFLLVLITTIHAHTEQREAIREMWGSPREVRGKQIVTLFLLAQNKDVNLTHTQQVVEESNKHHDLLQEDFQDAYKNLTLKTIMGMKWASTHCPHASYVMKTDDDIYVSYDNLVKHLTKVSTPSKNYAVGCLIRDALPFRDPESKWYMSKELYPGRKYSPYLSGAGYVVTGDLAGKIYQTSLKLQYLHIEDVFVGECLKSLHIMPMKSSQFTCWKNPGHSYCRLQQMITIHKLAPSEMRKMWSDHQRQIKCYNETDLITS